MSLIYPVRAKHHKGFTLVELLLIIVIISVLAAIVLSSLSASRQKARDAKRLADLKTIATVLELHYLEEGSYPLSVTWADSCDQTGDNWIPDGSDYDWPDPFIASMPRDPLENCSDPDPRSYAYMSDGTHYEITTELEGSGTPGPAGTYAYNGESFAAFIDTSPIGVSFSTSAGNPTNQSPIPITITFSRAVVNFTQSTLAVLHGFVSSVSALFDNVYQVFVTPTDNDTLVLTLSGEAVQDAQGVGNTAAQFTITYDSVLPHVALSPDPLPPTVSGAFSVTADFTVEVLDFSAGSISVQNGTVSNISGNGTLYTFTVTPTAPGAVSVVIPSNGAHSQAGNGNVASNSISTTFSN